MEEGSPQLVVRATALRGIFWVLFPHCDPVSRQDLNLFNSLPPALQPPFNEEGNEWDSGERVPLKAHKKTPLQTTDTDWPDRWEENEGTWHGNQGGKVAWPLSKWKGKSIKLKRPSRCHSTQSLFSERKRWAPAQGIKDWEPTLSPVFPQRTQHIWVFFFF